MILQAVIDALRVMTGFLPLKDEGALACPPTLARRRALLFVRGSIDGGRGGRRRAGEAALLSSSRDSWLIVRLIDRAVDRPTDEKRPLDVPGLAKDEPGRDEPTEPDIAEDGRKGESDDEDIPMPTIVGIGKNKDRWDVETILSQFALRFHSKTIDSIVLIRHLLESREPPAADTGAL